MKSVKHLFTKLIIM